ncbi:MAG TPA: FAD:protein FMN transferase [Bryobacteraceae bacterium]
MGFSRTMTAVGLALACSIGLWAGKLLRIEKGEEAMGSSFSVVLYGEDRAKMEAAAAAAFAELHRVDAVLSNYLPESQWSLMNSEAIARPVSISAELYGLLAKCMEYSRQSEGTFDITVGPLMRAWGFYKGEGKLPAAVQIQRALDRVGYRHVRLEPLAGTVQFDHAGVELDPGGVGKGYAVDRMVEVLKRAGVEIALVSGSGSSIYGLGAPPEEPRGWRVAIRAPDDPHRTAAEVFLKNMSLSTSGSYEKFFRAGGRIYSHIMDPRTGYPARGTSSVSVLAPRTIDSEVWAKPYFIQGRAWAAAHKPKNFRLFFCEDTKQPNCGWIP